MERKNFVLINNKILLNFKDMEYLPLNAKTLFDIKFLDGHMYYRGHDGYGKVTMPINYYQWNKEDQEEVDNAFDEYTNSTIEKIILNKDNDEKEES